MVDYVEGTCQNPNPSTCSLKDNMIKVHLHYDFDLEGQGHIFPMTDYVVHKPMVDYAGEHVNQYFLPPVVVTI